MCACSFVSCRSHGRNDGDDGDDEDDAARRRSREEEHRPRTAENREPTSDRGRNRPRSHNRSVFDPPRSSFELLREKIFKYVDTLCVFCKRVRNDPYQWSLFKAILWFTVGLKLFNDLARHAKVSALFGGTPPYEPPKKIEPPPTTPCTRKIRRNPERKGRPCLHCSRIRQPGPPCEPKPNGAVSPKAPPKPCPQPEEPVDGCEEAYVCCG